MILQLKGTTQAPLSVIVDDVRRVVSRICNGIDDMHLLGYKALVVRAEIVPARLQALSEALSSVSVDIDPRSLPSMAEQDVNRACVFTLQVKSFAADTDGSVTIPMVPG